MKNLIKQDDVNNKDKNHRINIGDLDVDRINKY